MIGDDQPFAPDLEPFGAVVTGAFEHHGGNATGLEAGVDRTQIFDESLHPAVLPSGMPSELRLRRPDLVEAERHLAAANARVDAARADMFPSIVLTGAAGRESAALSSLFTGPAGIYLLAASITQPIFAGGRLEARTGISLTPENAHAMLCGNPAMVEDVQKALNARGMRRHRRKEPGHITLETYW